MLTYAHVLMQLLLCRLAFLSAPTNVDRAVHVYVGWLVVDPRVIPTHSVCAQEGEVNSWYYRGFKYGPYFAKWKVAEVRGKIKRDSLLTARRQPTLLGGLISGTRA